MGAYRMEQNSTLEELGCTLPSVPLTVNRVTAWGW